MKVIPSQETISKTCSCGVTLVASVDDINENMHDGGYGFSCPKCGRYHKVDYNGLPESIKRELGWREVGH